jgi:hypothetical protein
VAMGYLHIMSTIAGLGGVMGGDARVDAELS